MNIKLFSTLLAMLVSISMYAQKPIGQNTGSTDTKTVSNTFLFWADADVHPHPLAKDLLNKAANDVLDAARSDCPTCNICHAVERLQKAIAIDSTYYFAYDNLIKYASQVECYQLALRYADRYIKVQPSDSLNIYGRRGLVRLKMGQEESAHKDFRSQIQALDRLSAKDATPIRMVIKAVYMALDGEKDQALALLNSQAIENKCKTAEDQMLLKKTRTYMRNATLKDLMNYIW